MWNHCYRSYHHSCSWFTVYLPISLSDFKPASINILLQLIINGSKPYQQLVVTLIFKKLITNIVFYFVMILNGIVVYNRSCITANSQISGLSANSSVSTSSTCNTNRCNTDNADGTYGSSSHAHRIWACSILAILCFALETILWIYWNTSFFSCNTISVHPYASFLERWLWRPDTTPLILCYHCLVSRLFLRDVTRPLRHGREVRF